MPGQQGFDHAGLPLKRIGLDFTLALQRPERLGHLQHMIRRGRIEMVGKKPINLRGAEATLRLQHQADGGRRRRLQTSQTVLNDMGGLMGQNIQLQPWLIAQPLGEAEAVDAHVVGSSLTPRAAAIEPIDDNAKAFKPLNQTIRSPRQRCCRGRRSNPDKQQHKRKESTKEQRPRRTRLKTSLRRQPTQAKWEFSTGT